MTTLRVTRTFSRSLVNAHSATRRCLPRVAKLMALAIVFAELIRDGVVADQTELAELGRVTRARISQIMALLSLAPAIQERLLDAASPTVTERQLRPIAATLDWRYQRRKWNAFNGRPVA